MASWVTHLRIADSVLKAIPDLCRHEFCVGNIAPDCNVENADWTSFTPPREVTHWMSGGRKAASDCDRFLNEYIRPRRMLSPAEESFLWGYYAHLVTDAEFQRFIRDEKRVSEVWKRIRLHQKLAVASAEMTENWDSVKALMSKKEWMKDIYALEREYLETHPDSGYLTEIMNLASFPDYLDYLPQGAIVRKIQIMGYMPQREAALYPYIAISKEEYFAFVEGATELVIGAILKHR